MHVVPDKCENSSLLKYPTIACCQINRGESIGTHGTVPHVMERDSVIIFPKVQELWVEGSPLYWLAFRQNGLPFTRKDEPHAF